MRFTTAWAEVSAQNGTLRILVLGMGALSAIFGVSLVKCGLQPPIIIERGCTSTFPTMGAPNPSPQEIEAFVKLVLPIRFDSNLGTSRDYLSETQKNQKAQEQQKLEERKLDQRIVIRNILISDETDKILVNADRLVSLGEIRSAFPVKLEVDLAKTQRTQGNPYGLVLNNVTELKKEKEKE